MDRNATTVRRNAVASQKALQHYLASPTRSLPALAYEICIYLADCYACGDIKRLGFRLATIGRWHQTNEFPDPTASPAVVALVRQIRGKPRIRRKEKLQRPPSITEIKYIAEAMQHRSNTSSDTRIKKTACRNSAIFLISFWFGLRIAQICRLRAKDINITETTLTITTDYLSGKGGQPRLSFQLGRLPALCPSSALENWLRYSSKLDGYLFPRTTRKSLPGPVGSRAVQADLKRLMGSSPFAGVSTRSMRYSLYFFLTEIGWTRQKILETLPFYGRVPSKTRIGNTRNLRSMPSGHSGISAAELLSIESVLSNSCSRQSALD